MKEILLVEDNGAIASDLVVELKKIGIDVHKAHSYLSAIGMWNKYKNTLKCIILDLNINPEGLSPKDNSKYYPVNALYFLENIGWINDNCIVNNNIDLIIYSGYINELKDVCVKYNLSLKNVKYFDKKSNSVIKLVKDINNMW